ncbi:hypothetical protein B296_00001246 [Ensete ventricosum]|uniref:Uncharacterized protein n=1 Tax=Ensete ventricosum TaxID=4639 RepID=A0A427B1P0_ENSVE|nr:hypothetical protein B296_00001246 [Ensete ventricosum]
MPVLHKVFPVKPSAQASKGEASQKTITETEVNEERQQQQQQQQKKKKKSNLEQAALTTPYLPFHMRPGLLFCKASPMRSQTATVDGVGAGFTHKLEKSNSVKEKEEIVEREELKKKRQEGAVFLVPTFPCHSRPSLL